MSTPLWITFAVACILIAAAAGALTQHRRGTRSVPTRLTPTEWLLWAGLGALLFAGVLLAVL